jgi:hypothetical protein
MQSPARLVASRRTKKTISPARARHERVRWLAAVAAAEAVAQHEPHPFAAAVPILLNKLIAEFGCMGKRLMPKGRRPANFIRDWHLKLNRPGTGRTSAADAARAGRPAYMSTAAAQVLLDLIDEEPPHVRRSQAAIWGTRWWQAARRQLGYKSNKAMWEALRTRLPLAKTQLIEYRRVLTDTQMELRAAVAAYWLFLGVLPGAGRAWRREVKRLNFGTLKELGKDKEWVGNNYFKPRIPMADAHLNWSYLLRCVGSCCARAAGWAACICTCARTASLPPYSMALPPPSRMQCHLD